MVIFSIKIKRNKISKELKLRLTFCFKLDERNFCTKNVQLKLVPYKSTNVQ